MELNLDEMDLTTAGSKVSYKEIKNYVLEHSGLKAKLIRNKKVLNNLRLYNIMSMIREFREIPMPMLHGYLLGKCILIVI